MVFVFVTLPLALGVLRAAVGIGNKIADAFDAKRGVQTMKEAVLLDLSAVVDRSVAEELLNDPRIIQGTWLAERLKNEAA